MTTLDYFLYDNRTWSAQWGRDWGLKAATGGLAARSDLKAAFGRYCGALPGMQGQLGGFAVAIGGVRPPTGEGYLLCVTLEGSDSFGRPSWSVCGLWCPHRATLAEVLAAGEPIGSIRALLGNEIPPKSIEIRAAKSPAPSKKRWRASEGPPLFRRFVPGETEREATSLLLGAAEGRGILPNVLGITASSRLAAIEREGFDVVYCLPMDDLAERALKHRLGQQEPEERDEPAERREDAPPEEPPSEPPRFDRPFGMPDSSPIPPPPRPAERSALVRFWPFGLVIAVAAGAFLLLEPVTKAIDRRAVPPVEDRGPETNGLSPPEEPSVETVLQEVGERLGECKRLSPEELRGSRGFEVAATLEVLPEYKERRAHVQRAYSALLEIRERMVKRQVRKNYVAYYYDESGKGTEPAKKLAKIAEILREASLGGEECRILEEAFGFEAQDRSSALRQWCDTLRRLDETVRNITVSPNHGVPAAGSKDGSARP